MNDTKTKLLDAAERLIGEHGYAATSLRQIISEAGANLASVHYHFGSKDELLDAVVMRRAAPVNDQRLALLDRYEAEAGGGAVPVARILEAFLTPMAQAAGHNPQFVRVMGRIVAEGMIRTVVEKNFHELLHRFAAALRKSLPALSDDEFRWRMVFMQGAMAHTMCGTPGSDFERRIVLLVRFLAGGFEAPPQEVQK
jgi:AcrR family transcriptional regulator